MLRNFLKKKNSNYLSSTASIVDLLVGAPSDSLVMEINESGEINSVKGILKANPSYDYHSLIGKSFKDFIHHDDIDRFENLFNQVLNGHIQLAENFSLVYADVMQLNLSFFPITSDNQTIQGVCCVVKQIAVPKATPLISYNKISPFNSNSKEIIGLLDEEGVIMYESQSTQHLLGYEVEHVIGEEFVQFIHENNRNDFAQVLMDVLQKPECPTTLELLFVDNKGDWHDYEVTFTNFLHNEEVAGILYNCREITEYKKQQAKIQYLSAHDTYTGLPNRRAFEERVDLEIKLATTFNTSFAVLSLNLEGHEFITNVVDHRLGETFIQEVAVRLKNEFNRHIELLSVANENGFFILTKNLSNPASIADLAEKIIQFLKRPFEFNTYCLYLTPKVGISVFPHTGQNTNELIMNAKSALFLADKTGTDQYRISSTADLNALHKLYALRNDLQFAIKRDQFKVFYQPIYHTNTNLIECVEALIRWEHPEHGYITPNEFIYLAEHYELIDEIGAWTIQTVIRDLARWHNKGFFVRASINVSLKQLKNPAFLQAIHSQLQEADLDAKWIDIEITENYKLDDEETLQRLIELQRNGFSLSLDDFGTGYNSLSNLQAIKPNKIKLDQLFIKELLTNKGSKSIISSVMQMAKELDVVVIAEGIETEEQKNILIDLHCDYLQGFLFSRPVTSSNVEKLLERQWKPEETQHSGRENRKYFRLDFAYPLEAQMTISEMNGKKVEVSKATILVKNIGAGGLLFVSDIKLPTEVDFVFQFDVKILDEIHSLRGTIAHHTFNNDLHYYGVQFIMTEIQRNKCISVLNKMQVMLQKSNVLPNHPFVFDQMQTFFNGRRKKMSAASPPKVSM
ncbi:EAL domain-containing protein [Sporosarcina saromensis]|uniref:EAL domain-containing protein n=1 Tax=Sporosarcina saromensis TaxID=359365 RepID=A0ABU4GBY9_9BACL|nr:EAL domain-containing protein [Sporosarcina saromensis]MDW0114453.1 EAL domain-containing protein [Sporosarcina saromensis]